MQGRSGLAWERCNCQGRNTGIWRIKGPILRKIVGENTKPQTKKLDEPGRPRRERGQERKKEINREREKSPSMDDDDDDDEGRELLKLFKRRSNPKQTDQSHLLFPPLLFFLFFFSFRLSPHRTNNQSSIRPLFPFRLSFLFLLLPFPPNLSVVSPPWSTEFLPVADHLIIRLHSLLLYLPALFTCLPALPPYIPQSLRIPLTLRSIIPLLLDSLIDANHSLTSSFGFLFSFLRSLCCCSRDFSIFSAAANDRSPSNAAGLFPHVLTLTKLLCAWRSWSLRRQQLLFPLPAFRTCSHFWHSPSCRPLIVSSVPDHVFICRDCG